MESREEREDSLGRGEKGYPGKVRTVRGLEREDIPGSTWEGG